MYNSRLLKTVSFKEFDGAEKLPDLDLFYALADDGTEVIVLEQDDQEGHLVRDVVVLPRAGVEKVVSALLDAKMLSSKGVTYSEPQPGGEGQLFDPDS